MKILSKHIDETTYNRFNKNRAIIRDYKNGVTQCYLINTNGELIHKFEPDIWVDTVEDDNVIFVDNNGLIALFDSNGQQLTDYKYSRILGGIEEGFFEVIDKNNKYGQLSITGEEVIPCIYDDSGYFEEGIVPMKLGEKWGMVNHKNETIIPFEYEDIFGCNNNRISAKLNGKWGVIDKFNNKLIDFKYDEICIYLIRDCGSIPARVGDKWGIIDIYDNVIYDFIYDDCDSLDEKGWYKFKQKDKWAIYSCERNSFISPFIYDEVEIYSSWVCKVKLNGKYDYVDTENVPVSDFCYDTIHHFYRTNLVSIYKNGKCGLMNTGGKILIEPKYDDCIKRASENMLVWEDNEYNQYVTDIDMNIIIQKRKYQKFNGGYNSGFISVRNNGYYNKIGKKLELNLKL